MQLVLLERTLNAICCTSVHAGAWLPGPIDDMTVGEDVTV